MNPFNTGKVNSSNPFNTGQPQVGLTNLTGFPSVNISSMLNGSIGGIANSTPATLPKFSSSNSNSLSQNSIDNILSSGGQVISQYKPTFGQKVSSFLNSILPGVRPEETKNPESVQIKVPFLNRVFERPNTNVETNIKGLIEWPERVFNDIGAIKNTLTGQQQVDNPDQFKVSAGNFIKDMGTFHDSLIQNGMGDTGATILSGIFGASIGTLDVIPAMGFAKSLLENVAKNAVITPVEHLATWEALGRPSTVREAESTAKGLLVDLSNKTNGFSTPESAKLASEITDLMKVMREKGIPDSSPAYVKAATDLNKILDTNVKNLPDVLGVKKMTPFVSPAGELPGYRDMAPGMPAGLSSKAVEPVGFEAKPPVTAFSKVKLDKLADFDISKEEAQKLLRTMFDTNEMAFMTTKKLINGDSLGRFSNNILNLIKVVEFGDKLPSQTLFHEAFHGYFNTFITDAERSSILAKVKSDWSTLPYRADSLLNGYKGQDTRLEEWLADDFARYAKAKKLGETPKSIFAKLWDSMIAKIRSWAGKLNEFNSLYEDILNKKRTGHVETPYRPTIKFEKGSIDSEELTNAKLNELQTHEAILSDTVKNNPARQLSKYANANGEIPEVLGTGGKFGKSGDDVVTQLGFKDSEEARQAYQDYRKQADNLDEIQQQIRETRLELKDLRKPIVLSEDPLFPDTANEAQLSELAQETPATALQQLQDSYKSDTPFTKIVLDTNTPVKVKVGMLDYLRTPDRVLQKIGLGKVSVALRNSYDSYLKELPAHLQVITDWSKQVSKEGNKNIFKWLDGRDVQLSPTEQKVASEVKEYLGHWADRLGLPADNQISHYITHIFEIGDKQKEFDEEIAKIIKDKVPGSVYDPFLEKRLGAKGYVEDTWRALDAYVKRAVRKANMDPALKILKDSSHNLEDSQLKYVERLGARINMRPTEWDTLLDNTIKQLVGYRFGQRPTAVISGSLRKMVYRGALGLNVTSAVKNLTQGVNTFAKLGTINTTIGYINLLKPGSSRELSEVGVMREGFIQDRTLSATKQTLQKFDKGLFVMFEMAEKINRGSAYFGAKAKAIRGGASELEAVNYAKKMVRDTQFVFGSIDTPVAMQGDIAKTLLQFGSYSQKQTEFLVEMAKNKEYAGIIRYIVASLAVVYTVGKVFNITGQNFNPLNYFARFGTPPALALPISILKAVLNIPDQYGKTPTTKAKIKDIIYSGKTLIPAGVQLSKLSKGKVFGGSTSSKPKATSNPFDR